MTIYSRHPERNAAQKIRGFKAKTTGQQQRLEVKCYEFNIAFSRENPIVMGTLSTGVAPRGIYWSKHGCY